MLSATAQRFEIGDREDPHRVRSGGRRVVTEAYLDVQEQQISPGQWATLAERHKRADDWHTRASSGPFRPVRSVPTAQLPHGRALGLSPLRLSERPARAAAQIWRTGSHPAAQTWRLSSRPGGMDSNCPDRVPPGLLPGYAGGNGSADSLTARDGLERVDSARWTGSAVPPGSMGQPARGRVDDQSRSGGL